MSFREINSKYLEPASMWMMIFGIVALCQPWIFFLHRYGATIIIIGLVCFLITSHISPKPFVRGSPFAPSAFARGKNCTRR